FVVEDLHWVDPSTLELLRLLAGQGATAPLLLLFTTRPEFSAPWPSRAHHAQITLNRLSRHDARAMVTRVAGDTPLPAETVAALEALAGEELIYARGLPPEASYSFRHALVQESAYESLLKRTRQELHGRVVRALVAEFPARAEAEPEVVARHAEAAGLAEEAV